MYFYEFWPPEQHNYPLQAPVARITESKVDNDFILPDQSLFIHGLEIFEANEIVAGLAVHNRMARHINFVCIHAIIESPNDYHALTDLVYGAAADDLIKDGYNDPRFLEACADMLIGHAIHSVEGVGERLLVKSDAIDLFQCMRGTTSDDSDPKLRMVDVDMGTIDYGQFEDRHIFDRELYTVFYALQDFSAIRRLGLRTDKAEQVQAAFHYRASILEELDHNEGRAAIEQLRQIIDNPDLLHETES